MSLPLAADWRACRDFASSRSRASVHDGPDKGASHVEEGKVHSFSAIAEEMAVLHLRESSYTVLSAHHLTFKHLEWTGEPHKAAVSEKQEMLGLSSRHANHANGFALSC
mmetsp:Transcript_74133/g.192562  ORF Transcript_74133/g.192562 Transcript_74133/m.192562 type:complete len:109 (-) Transcript_74133:802-1128(-)